MKRKMRLSIPFLAHFCSAISSMTPWLPGWLSRLFFVHSKKLKLIYFFCFVFLYLCFRTIILIIAYEAFIIWWMFGLRCCSYFLFYLCLALFIIWIAVLSRLIAIKTKPLWLPYGSFHIVACFLFLRLAATYVNWCFKTNKVPNA